MNIPTPNKKKLIIITGPTAVGKTQLSIDLALKLETEIISCDSRQIYNETTIGTAKPSNSDLNLVKHHFINHISINEDFSVGDYEKQCDILLDSLFENKDNVIMSGGTGLYIKAVIEGLDTFPVIDKSITEYYESQLELLGLESLQNELKNKDPNYFTKVDIGNKRRLIRALSVIKQSKKSYSSFLNQKVKELPFKVFYFVLQRDRKELYERINQRVDQMMEFGLLSEVKSLLEFQNNRSLQTVGYQELFKYLNNEWTSDFAIEKIKQHSRNYAKRQITWFNKIETKIILDATENNLEKILNLIK